MHIYIYIYVWSYFFVQVKSTYWQKIELYSHSLFGHCPNIPHRPKWFFGTFSEDLWRFFRFSNFSRFSNSSCEVAMSCQKCLILRQVWRSAPTCAHFRKKSKNRKNARGGSHGLVVMYNGILSGFGGNWRWLGPIPRISALENHDCQWDLMISSDFQ